VNASDAFAAFPEPQQTAARKAVGAAFPSNGHVSLEPISGGASGALICRLELESGNYLLRIETQANAFRNPHQYTCMALAAEAGIAPAIRFLDVERGVVIMDLVETIPLEEYPGGPWALVAGVAELACRLQSTTDFPRLLSYRAMLRRMLAAMSSPALFNQGLLDDHLDAFEHIDAVCPVYDASVSSHNDPNRRNVLFDGRRLWLIDWETAYSNDPITDIAILAENFAPSRTLEDRLLTVWSGRPPDEALRARLYLMRLMTRLYYAGLVLTPLVAAPAATPDRSLEAPTPEAFTRAVANGSLPAGSRPFMLTLGKLYLSGFLEGVRSARFKEATRLLEAR